MASPVAIIDATGISAPVFADVLAYFQNGMRNIYGPDLYLEADSQDGQMVALFALGVHDLNSAIIATYNSFSPATAVGNGLSSNVKINGITRLVPSFSTVDVVLSGNVGTTIINGIVTDANQTRWMLPPTVTIGVSGSITVTATASAAGAVQAAIGSVTQILTPTLGWISVTNTAAGVVGEPLETDFDLRVRQALSVALPSRSITDGLVGALLALANVTRIRLYENVTTTPDSNGLPGNSICVVIEGGDSTAIAGVMRIDKGVGSNTYGTTSIVVQDAYGIPRTMSFTRPTVVPIAIVINLRPLTGYTSVIGAAVIAAVLAFAQANMAIIGTPVYVTRLYTAANLPVAQGGATYDVLGITITRSGGSADGYGNLPIAWTERPDFTNCTITVTP